MSRQRLPDNVHKMKGTYQPVRHGKKEEKPEIQSADTVPEAPPELSDNQKKHYYRVATWLFEHGLLTEVNFTAVVQYAILYDKLITEGCELRAEYHGQLRMVQSELGITPSSQGKLRLLTGPKKTKEEDNPWGKI